MFVENHPVPQALPIILLGAGGHAKVVLSLLLSLNLPIQGVSAPELLANASNSWRGIPVISNIADFLPHQVLLVNGVGLPPSRQKVFDKFKERGYVFATLIHPTAYVDESVSLGEGVQVMVGAIIQADTCVGDNVIINTRASVDHDCIIGDHVHIAPGAILCGRVFVADNAMIASGSVVAQNICVGAGAIAGAGVSVVRNMNPKSVIIPAKIRVINAGECA